MTQTTITIEAVVAGTPEKIWDFWTKPEYITQWNFASDDWCCPSASNDLKAGGQYHSRMEAKDGSFGFDFVAVYDEVTRPRSMTYTLEDGRKVITRFEAIGNTTKITTTFDAESQNSIELQRNGWQAILNNFKKMAEAQ